MPVYEINLYLGIFQSQYSILCYPKATKNIVYAAYTLWLCSYYVMTLLSHGLLKDYDENVVNLWNDFLPRKKKKFQKSNTSKNILWLSYVVRNCNFKIRYISIGAQEREINQTITATPP